MCCVLTCRQNRVIFVFLDLLLHRLFDLRFNLLLPITPHALIVEQECVRQTVVHKLQHFLCRCITHDDESTRGQWNAREQLVIVQLDRPLLLVVLVLLASEHYNRVAEQVDQHLFGLF